MWRWTSSESPSSSLASLSRACSHRRPPLSRWGRLTRSPPRRKSTSAIAGGTGKDSGKRGHRKEPWILCSPRGNTSAGTSPTRRSSAGRPSTNTSRGKKAAPPGSGRSSSRSACTASSKRPPRSSSSSLSTPGQAQTRASPTSGQASSGCWSSTQGTQGSSGLGIAGSPKVAGAPKRPASAPTQISRARPGTRDAKSGRSAMGGS